MTQAPFQQVTIVGLGLIGGSIAKGLRERYSDLHLLAVDRGEVGQRSDVKDVINTFIEVDHVDLATQIINKSDLVVLCQPVRAIAESIASYVTPGCAVTDTGSTKRQITASAAGCLGASWFVPGHPMAGKAQGGYENSCADLFVGRPWIVCSEGREPAAVRRVQALIECLGARMIGLSPEAHDAQVALVSHVPQLLASWLQVVGREHGALAVAGPTYNEMTRVAGGSEAIWRDIFETNADQIGLVLAEAAGTWARLAEALLTKPPQIAPVLELLERARRA